MDTVQSCTRPLEQLLLVTRTSCQGMAPRFWQTHGQFRRLFFSSIAEDDAVALLAYITALAIDHLSSISLPVLMTTMESI